MGGVCRATGRNFSNCFGTDPELSKTQGQPSGTGRILISPADIQYRKPYR